MDDLEDEEYDLIVSNPPFYSENVSSGDDARDKARQNESLPFEDLIEASAVLLSEKGILCVIIPFKEEQKFIDLAEAEGLFPTKITRVKGTPETEIKRSLLAFSRQRSEVEIEMIAIENARHDYTGAYRELTQDFYLNM